MHVPGFICPQPTKTLWQYVMTAQELKIKNMFHPARGDKQIHRQVPEKLRVSGPGGAETPSVNVPPLILLFPQDSIRQKWSSLIVTVRILEVSEVLKWSGPWLYYVHSVHYTSFSNLIELN